MRLWFVSDLHLAPSGEALEQWQDFLEAAREVDALYILGDFFEYWVGDRQVREPFFSEIASTLASFAQTSAPVFLLDGNRDFLLGKQFFTLTHVQKLPDPSLICIGQKKIILTHGDSLCTDDIAYQRFRKLARNPVLQKIFLSLPYFMRLKLASRARRKSMNAQNGLSPFITDVNPKAVQAMMMRFGVDTMIHGHTHRPHCHRHQGMTRWVLPSWENGPAVLAYENDRFFFSNLYRDTFTKHRKIP